MKRDTAKAGGSTEARVSASLALACSACVPCWYRNGVVDKASAQWALVDSAFVRDKTFPWCKIDSCAVFMLAFLFYVVVFSSFFCLVRFSALYFSPLYKQLVGLLLFIAGSHPMFPAVPAMNCHRAWQLSSRVATRRCTPVVQLTLTSHVDGSSGF